MIEEKIAQESTLIIIHRNKKFKENFIKNFKIVFKFLKLIKYGSLELTNFDNKKYIFGDLKEELKVKIKINKPGFTYQIIKNGSIGLAEAYIKGDFETDNLTNLIELSAKNIKVIHKFSGFLDFPFVNSLKNIFIKNV